MTSMPVAATEPFVDVDRARMLLGEAGVDALAASSLRNLCYLSGLVSLDYLCEPDASAFAVLGAGDEAFVTVPVAGCYVLEEYPVWPRTIFFGNFYIEGGPPVEVEAPDAVAALARGLGELGLDRGRIGLELDLLPVALHRRIADALPGATLVDATPMFRELRMRKTQPEVERIRTATRALERAIGDAMGRIGVGVREREIDRWVRESLIEQGVEPVTIGVGSRNNGANVWSYATDRAVERGDVIRFDCTCSYGFYHSDLARTCVVGEATPEHEAYYAAVHGAVEAGIGAVRAGGSTRAVYEAALAVPHAAGFADFRRHNFGHSVGLQVHEAPLLTAEEQEIPGGAVLAVESPYYIYGLGGFASEDVLIVRDDGNERLTYAPSALPVVG